MIGGRFDKGSSAVAGTAARVGRTLDGRGGAGGEVSGLGRVLLLVVVVVVVEAVFIGAL